MEICIGGMWAEEELMCQKQEVLQCALFCLGHHRHQRAGQFGNACSAQNPALAKIRLAGDQSPNTFIECAKYVDKGVLPVILERRGPIRSREDSSHEQNS